MFAYGLEFMLTLAKMLNNSTYEGQSKITES